MTNNQQIQDRYDQVCDRKGINTVDLSTTDPHKVTWRTIANPNYQPDPNLPNYDPDPTITIEA